MEMVQVKFLQAIACAKGVWGPGEVATVDPQTAEQWCKASIAERIREPASVLQQVAKVQQKGKR